MEVVYDFEFRSSSAERLRSSVVSVLFSLISEWLAMSQPNVNPIFEMGWMMKLASSSDSVLSLLQCL